MNRLLEQFSELTTLDAETASKILVSLFIILGIGALRLLTIRVVNSKTEDVRIRYNWRKGITYTCVIIGILVASGQVYAGSVEIVQAAFYKQGSQWRVEVTLKHADSGWDHYADAWRVVLPTGKVAGTRTLSHPHINEQPFTRSLVLNIPENIHQHNLGTTPVHDPRDL